MKYLLIVTLLLTACNESKPVPAPVIPQVQQIPQQAYPEQQYQQPPQVMQQPAYYPPVQQAPVIVQQPQQSHSGVTDMLVGGLIGHAVGNALNGTNRSAPQQPQQPQVINKTIINKTYVSPRPTYSSIRPSSSYSRPSSSRSLRR